LRRHLFPPTNDNMSNNIFFKTICLALTIFFLPNCLWGQASLPFLYDGGNPGITVAGLTQTGLGTDYISSPKMKFDTSGANLILNFSGVPGILSFKLRWNQSTPTTRFPGDFALQESADGLTYSAVQLYNASAGTALANGAIVTESFTTLLSSSRFLKWIYSTRSNGNIALGGVNLTEGLNFSTNLLIGFGYLAGSASSGEQSFTVSGNNLTNNISLSPPADYEISTGTGTAFVATNPLLLIHSGGVVPNIAIYVRLKSGLVSGTYNENIMAAVAGGNTYVVACRGIVAPNPTVTLTDITDPTLTTISGSSVSQEINVSGMNLSADLGLAISGTDASLFTLSNYSVVQTGGTVPNTVVTITYTPNVVGSNVAYLTTTSVGAMSVVRTLNGISSIATGLNSSNKSFAVNVENGNVVFHAAAGESIRIFNTTGQRLLQKFAVEGMNRIPVSAKGVLLVKAGDRFAKVIM